MILRTIAILAVLTFGIQSSKAQDEPHDVAARVADRLITETVFGLDQELRRGEQEGFYLIDFLDAVGQKQGVYEARTELRVDSTTADEDLRQLALGISASAGNLEVTVDGRSVYTGSGDLSKLQHIGYGHVLPAVTVPLGTGIGASEVIVRFDPVGQSARVWLGLIDMDAGTATEHAEFVLPDELDAGESSRFLVAASDGGWIVPRVRLVSALPHRLAYSDWRYFTGTFLDALLNVSGHFPDLDYVGYVETHMDFFLQQRPIIERERRLRGLIESPFGHYFRFTLLDDMAMQAVPFAERLRRNPGGTRFRADREVVDRSLDHIMNGALRLEDGTWSRLHDDSVAVWADDLFMGSVLLVRMAEIDNQPTYLHEAVRQAFQMDDHLGDPESGLYWHGYFVRGSEHSSSKWGRANGWTMMAKTEILLGMPEDHPDREALLQVFQRHAAGLRDVQSEDGRWHQVLDNPDTYLETSCTAMFTRAFAEGIVNGWLPEEDYLEATERGWAAVARQVRPDGLVEGIVRGTPIFYSDEEYQNHPTRLNDPRGLGAVMYAAVSMSKLRDKLGR
jgi:rhamnogalacturonyl hydrolase YesR